MAFIENDDVIKALATDRSAGDLLVNFTNYAKKPVTVRIEGLPVTGRVDLLTTKPVGDTLTIEPLATHLIAADVE